MTPKGQTAEMLDEQLVGLRDSIKKASNVELKIDEIVQIYYQVISISCIIKALKPQSDKQTEILQRITGANMLIKKEFDVQIHPRILEQLSEKIKTLTRELSTNSQAKTKQEIKDEGKAFDRLREMLSTKEFVKQYDKELGHD